MICAYIHPWCEAALHKVDAMALRARLAVRAAIVTVTVTVFAVWYQTVYVLPKLEYNALHPYTSWIPISCWAVLRNLTPGTPGARNPGLKPCPCPWQPHAHPRAMLDWHRW